MEIWETKKRVDIGNCVLHEGNVIKYPLKVLEI